MSLQTGDQQITVSKILLLMTITGRCLDHAPVICQSHSIEKVVLKIHKLMPLQQDITNTWKRHLIIELFRLSSIYCFFFEIDNVASHLLLNNLWEKLLAYYLSQNSQNVCNNFFTYFQLLTITNTIYDLNTENQFLINFCFSTYSLFSEIGIRNVLIYVNPCHPTCLKCNGPLKTNCLTCFDGQVVSGGQCQCISEQQFSETFIGCSQECNRDYSIARNDKFLCKTTELNHYQHFFRIKQFLYQMIIDQFHPKNNDLIYKDCRAYDFICELQFNEGMLYQMNLQDSVKFLPRLKSQIIIKYNLYS
ncbi:unnamed protein product [Paramecium octaurelia]|uniref:Uncharacterized protein n=1 Tax=Paramecium octaurelia TaxID=43137 RepID=A0A8S1U3K5_PAROT|nr:unnamed protein product [Paramecium octaurelia]